MKHYCIWQGFVWFWSIDHGDCGEWIIDLERSGGPPSPHNPTPECPPLAISYSEGEVYLRLKT